VRAALCAGTAWALREEMQALRTEHPRSACGAVCGHCVICKRRVRSTRAVRAALCAGTA